MTACMLANVDPVHEQACTSCCTNVDPELKGAVSIVNDSMHSPVRLMVDRMRACMHQPMADSTCWIDAGVVLCVRARLSPPTPPHPHPTSLSLSLSLSVCVGGVGGWGGWRGQESGLGRPCTAESQQNFNMVAA